MVLTILGRRSLFNCRVAARVSQGGAAGRKVLSLSASTLAGPDKPDLATKVRCKTKAIVRDGEAVVPVKILKQPTTEQVRGRLNQWLAHYPWPRALQSKQMARNRASTSRYTSWMNDYQRYLHLRWKCRNPDLSATWQALSMVKWPVLVPNTFDWYSIENELERVLNLRPTRRRRRCVGSSRKQATDSG
ncbi:hypothetical protein IE53DRAFT_366298 [Violaceomyces palustris]|uniref:Uncharacterized protein n=1 Tax=Violaceomyces palustris TaxID=1673888 RepID=A0ACD0P652_9BASI|nr:hypothetical protein IE53DRAFT_366298 [Violaceomyces palustris]